MAVRPIKTISVIGAGSWGTALARLLARKGFTIRLWAYEQEVVQSIRDSHSNSLYLPNVLLPDSLSATHSLAEAIDSTDLLLLAVPSHAMRQTFEAMSLKTLNPIPVTIATKGIEETSLNLMSDIVTSKLPSAWHSYVTILSGPSFALEVCQEKPTTILLAGRLPELVTELQNVFLTPHFRVYAGHDMIGAQIGGALKNVMAIASGIVDGLDLGFNARAALITRGLAEMTRLGTAMGAEVSTLSGLSGLGDLVLTCTGSLSRNYTVGLKLGQGSKLDDILSHTPTVAEGVRTARAAMGLAAKHNIEMPIVEGVHQVLFAGINPRQAVINLMSRTAKVEAAPGTTSSLSKP